MAPGQRLHMQQWLYWQHHSTDVLGRERKDEPLITSILRSVGTEIADISWKASAPIHGFEKRIVFKILGDAQAANCPSGVPWVSKWCMCHKRRYKSTCFQIKSTQAGLWEAVKLGSKPNFLTLQIILGFHFSACAWMHKQKFASFVEVSKQALSSLVTILCFSCIFSCLSHEVMCLYWKCVWAALP